MDDGGVEHAAERAIAADAAIGDPQRSGRMLLAGGVLAGLTAAAVLWHSTYDRGLAAAGAAFAGYALFSLLLFPPFSLRSDGLGIEVSWGEGTTAAVRWDEIGTVSIRSRTSNRFAKLGVYARDLRPAIRRSRSRRVKFLLWARQLMPRRPFIYIPRQAVRGGDLSDLRASMVARSGRSLAR